MNVEHISHTELYMMGVKQGIDATKTNDMNVHFWMFLSIILFIFLTFEMICKYKKLD